MSDLYHVSSSPHVRSKDTTSKIMLYVIMALLPTSLFGIYNFGIRALILILVTIASCVASEWIFNKIVHKKNSIDDLSAVVTGLLLALNLPASLPWWEAVIGGVFAIVIVKMMFGGLGQNFMNPALGARCFLLIAFAADMTNFTVGAYSGATPLAQMRNGEAVNTMSMLIGGGLMLGAFFMATDYVTSPITPRGQIIFGICCGIFTGLFRCFGANAEGVSFAIILSNLLVPMIEKYTVPNAFGVVKTKPEKEAK